jgi:hypothetical protein
VLAPRGVALSTASTTENCCVSLQTSLLQLSDKERRWDAQLRCYQRLFQPNLNKGRNVLKRDTEGIRATIVAVE